MLVLGATLPLHRHPAVNMPLYPHQCALLDAWEERDAFILSTRTGSGKTAAVTLPVIHNNESAVFIYPTNALIADQERSILKLFEKQSLSVRVISPDNVNEKSGDDDYHLIRIDANRLEEFRVAMKMKDKGSAMLRLIQPSRPKILLINPDLLYLIFSLKYGRTSAELIAHFLAYRSAVFDEFHLYSGVELAHVLFLIHLAREFGGFSRIVLLSATPSTKITDLLNKALKEPLMIDATVKTSHTKIGERTVIYPLNFECRNSGSDEVEAIISYLKEKKHDLEAARATSSDMEYVPAVVILNSVVSAIRIEDCLVKAGWKSKKIGAVRGLMAKAERQIADKVIIIGTAAIEVGIDFKTDLLLFEAGDTASFLQRIGRLGRHGLGTAILFGDSREVSAFQFLPDEVSRDKLEYSIKSIFKGRDSFAWFPGTFSGALTMIAQTESIYRKVQEDRKGMETAKVEIRAWLDVAVEKFGAMMGWEKQFKQAKKRVQKARNAVSIGRWITDYIEQVSFRSSIPTVEVYDWAEVKRGRCPEYEADLLTLLKWGNRSPKYLGKTGAIYIEGFRSGKPHKLYLSATFENEEIGIMLTTKDFPFLKVMQDGHLTSISHLFTLRPHVFVLVPLDFAKRLDWRLPWFRCGSQGNKAAIFDGPALIVWEMWKEANYNISRA
ncbi:MAG: type I-D CRISPR-associated helicase Cas3' [Dethiobacter sp.]|jgi:CRISPR-associated helicase Cas3|nr:MAG: type I-D CRISPR-associated helicase Cas3' [Dethiobacter sp.]